MQTRCSIIAGPISVSVSGEKAVVDLIENFFGYTYRTSRAATRHDWAVTVVADESMPQRLEIPTTSAVEWVMEHDERGLGYTGPGWIGIVTADKNGSVFLDLGSHQITVWGASPAYCYHLGRKVVRQVLTVSLENRGWCRAHASAVAGRSGGLAFFGESGSGKTTALLHLLAGRQWKFIANDLVLIDPRTGEIIGWPTTSMIGLGSIRAVPEYQHLVPPRKTGDPLTDDDRKIAFSQDEFIRKFAVEPSLGASLKQILLPGLDLRVESRLSEKLAPDDAKREIAKHIITDDPDHPNWLHLDRSPASPDSQADLLCSLVPIRRLTLGHDFRTFARRLDCLGGPVC